MIHMAMRVEQQFYLQLVVIDKVLKNIAFFLISAAWIDDYTFVGFVEQHVGVLLKGIKNECLNF